MALAEAYRNVATTGARPLAVTNCLNFGSPEDPAVMWQFAEAVRGLADGCQTLGIPVTGGNVSFYNQTGATPILPTPVIGVLGLIDDVERRTEQAFYGDGGQLYLLGDTADEFGGSEWANVAHGFLGGIPPKVDLQRERLLADILINASRDGLIDAAHDLSDGGLFQAVAEGCLRGDAGVRLIAARRPGSVRVPLLRVGRASRRGGAAHRGGAVHRHVHRPRAAGAADRRAGHPGVRDRGPGAVPHSVVRAAQRVDPDACRGCSADPWQPTWPS